MKFEFYLQEISRYLPTLPTYINTETCTNICVREKVIHVGLNCKQYQEMTKKDLETSADASKTKSLLQVALMSTSFGLNLVPNKATYIGKLVILQEMVEKGDAMICPTCEIILMKKWGCDWLRCSMCKTEICWVTRGSRWGPTVIFF